MRRWWRWCSSDRICPGYICAAGWSCQRLHVRGEHDGSRAGYAATGAGYPEEWTGRGVRTCVAHYDNLRVNSLVVSGLPVGVHTRIFCHHGGTTGRTMGGAARERGDDGRKAEAGRVGGGREGTENAKESLLSRLRRRTTTATCVYLPATPAVRGVLRSPKHALRH